MTPTSGEPVRVAVLIATYNGERFLSRQLETIEQQSISKIDVWASDDGSTDNTLTILESLAGWWGRGRFEILRGPGKGFAENFRALLRLDIDADYIAFCDQDDVWRPDKLANAAAWLSLQPPDVPALYCSRTELIDENGRPIGASPLFRRPPGLRNALVQSIAGGNTMVLNRVAYRLVAESARRTEFITHDWWSYLVVTAAGGRVHYSPHLTIGYRQHDDNIVGSNDTWAARLSRLDLLLAGRFAEWTNVNLAGLDACRDLLSDEGRRLIDGFRQLRSKSALTRLIALYRLGLYRQTSAGQASLYLACLLNRL